jgi:hypothetical protein
MKKYLIGVNRHGIRALLYSIVELYRIEAGIAGSTHQQRRAARQERSAPRIAELETWLCSTSGHAYRQNHPWAKRCNTSPNIGTG